MPCDGGILDQPAGLLKKMRTALNVHHAFSAFERYGKTAGEMAKWKQDHTDLWNIVMEINELRENYGR